MMPTDASPNKAIIENDEVDLLQLWQILARRKLIVLVCFFVCVAAGTAFALLKPDVFRYTTVIDIGSISGRKVISAEQGLGLLETTIIPLVREADSKKYNEYSPEIRVAIPKGSQLIVVTSEGEIRDSKRLMEIHVALFEGLKREVQQEIDNARSDVKSQLTQYQQGLAELLDQEERLVSKEKQLADMYSVLTEQIATIEKDLAEMYKPKPQNIASADGEASNMALLIKEKEELRRSKQLDKLDIEKIGVELVKFDHELSMKREDKKKQISATENEITKVLDMRVLNIAARSLKAMGPGKAVVLILSSLFGIMCGVIFAFFVEFIYGVRVGQQE